ncbi:MULTISPECIES: SRPBCC family protein [Maribacter]|uniref:SRPBCC family protein n=1 Tax=Maribacter flavus TaxID=1658664 RepID=A0A5B2TTT3_9FLAO|nr:MULTISPECIES: SRPBCC family protein [Maribacter]KAA2217155.1 SRPBCC family protein [Maribacter flavus]MDC6405430.1 SRPBCC family protein [Maribacter sp. PR66]MEE1972802.1 SRPBCC family protein [Maribacter flavus]
MKLYQLKSKQYLPISQSEAWQFLSNPANLKVITPEHMGFDILDGADRKMFPGQIIQYIVKPFPGYSTKWVTEITHVQAGSYFVDEQRFGPYKLWHHKHFISEIPGGVLMEDIIDYKLPFGILGRMSHPFLVKKQLKQIFMHREQKLTSLFGSMLDKQNTVEFKSI